MPRQVNQLQTFYNSITNDGVKIKPIIHYCGRVSFMVEGESHVESFSVAYYNNYGISCTTKGSNTIKLSSSNWIKRGTTYYTQNVDLCSFKRGSAGYRLLNSLFNNLAKLDFNTHYDGKEFCNNTFSPFIKALLSLNNQLTTIESTTTELSGLKQVIEEIKKSNASNGITIQNVENVQNKTNILDNPMIHDTNLRGFKLLETPSNEKNNIVFTVGMLAMVVVLLAAIAAAVPFKCWFCNRKNKSHSSSKEETPSSSLLSAITLESRGNSII